MQLRNQDKRIVDTSSVIGLKKKCEELTVGTKTESNFKLRIKKQIVKTLDKESEALLNYWN